MILHAQICFSHLEGTTPTFDFALAFAKIKIAIVTRIHISVLMWALTTIREVNYRCSRKRWFFPGRPGSRRIPLRLHKSRKIDTAARYNAPLPTAAAIRLSRIVSALSRICNIQESGDYLSQRVL